MLIAFEGIAANELGKAIRLVRVGGTDRAHFIEDDVDAALGQLPGGFGTGQSASHNNHFLGGLQTLFYCQVDCAVARAFQRFGFGPGGPLISL